MARILITGSRKWGNPDAVRVAIELAGKTRAKRPQDVTIVHGDAVGADQIADTVARSFGCQVEKHPASGHPDPLARNRHMVACGADVCLAFADRWASGTGACAREARKAGIRVIDMGVNTSTEARP